MCYWILCKNISNLFGFFFNSQALDQNNLVVFDAFIMIQRTFLYWFFSSYENFDRIIMIERWPRPNREKFRRRTDCFSSWSTFQVAILCTIYRAGYIFSNKFLTSWGHGQRLSLKLLKILLCEVYLRKLLRVINQRCKC